MLVIIEFLLLGLHCTSSASEPSNLATAETAVDLRAPRHRLEKLPSTEIVDPRGVLPQHMMSPSPNSAIYAHYEPHDNEEDYFEHKLMHDDILLGNKSLSVQLNSRKLFDQVFAADGSESVLSDNRVFGFSS